MLRELWKWKDELEQQKEFMFLSQVMWDMIYKLNFGSVSIFLLRRITSIIKKLIFWNLVQTIYFFQSANSPNRL